MDDADDGGGDGDGDGEDLRLSFLYVQTPDQPGAWRGTSYVILPPWPISPVLFLPRAVPRGSDDLAHPIVETKGWKKTCKTEHREPNEANAKGGAQGPQEPCSR